MRLNRLCITLVAGAALLGALVRSEAQSPVPTSDYTHPFDSDPPSWIYWYGLGYNNTQITWDPSMDASTNANSGSLLISLPFGPPSQSNAQGVWFGTFGDGGIYDGSIRYNALGYFTNIQVDVFVAPTNTPSPAGDFGALQISLVRVGTPSGGGPFPASTTATIPGDATNRWVHLSVPVNTGADAAGFDDPGVIGVVMRKANFGGNPFQGYPQVPLTFWLDNVTVKFSGTPPPPPPPPTMSIDRPVGGLNLFAAGGDYDRAEIRTLGTDSGLQYSWVGRGSTPVTYSFTIAGYPGPGHQNFQTHIYLVPSPLTSAGGDRDIAPDYHEPNVIFMDLDLQGNGSANCAFRWKTNTLSDNGTFYTSPLAQIANPTALGTWSLTFVNDTNVTMRTPSGSSTNFSIDPNLGELFPNPIYVYFGIMPDATAQANKGQAIILSRARVQGSIDTIDDDFLSDTNGLDTANIWTIEAGGGQTQSVFILPPDASQGFWVNWTSANSAGFALQTNSVLGNSNSFPWSTNGLPDPLQLGLLKRTLLSSNNLPGGARGFFRLGKPGF